ncbi:hypothetical protein BGW38_009998, partial [Lunasporangiospora selenospora]
DTIKAPNLFNVIRSLYNYNVHGSGPLTSQGAESACFVRLEDVAPEFVAREKANGTWQDPTSGPESPHFEVLFVPSSQRHHGLVRETSSGNFFTLIGLLLNPLSRGRVTISDVKDGKLETLIDPNYFSDPFDTRVMAEMVRFIRRIGARMAQDPEVGGEEIFPGVDKVPSDDESKLQDYVKRESSVYYHPTTTCKMGPASDPMAVVDTRLNVYGIERLRVVDASIIPKLPAAHTCAPTIMIAEKAADMIKEDWQDPTKEGLTGNWRRLNRTGEVLSSAVVIGIRGKGIFPPAKGPIPTSALRELEVMKELDGHVRLKHKMERSKLWRVEGVQILDREKLGVIWVYAGIKGRECLVGFDTFCDDLVIDEMGCFSVGREDPFLGQDI